MTCGGPQGFGGSGGGVGGLGRVTYGGPLGGEGPAAMWPLERPAPTAPPHPAFSLSFASPGLWSCFVWVQSCKADAIEKRGAMVQRDCGTRPLLKGGPTGMGGGVGGWVHGLWVGGLVWFWAI